MTTIQLQLPESLLEKVQSLAARENISASEFAAAAVAEKVQAADQLEYFRSRGARSSREKFLLAMSKVPHVPPVSPDEPPPPEDG